VRKNFTDIKIITNNARENFAHNNNAAASVANGEFLCLLNNDTIVLAGWLDEMLAVARADERIGVVGNRHITPGTDQLNHGGMAFDQRYNPVHICVGNSKNDPRALETRDMQCVTAACWLVRKRIFMELGGFDTNFKNGYEDVDFCLKASAAGFRIVYVGKSAIYHYGQSSPGRLAHDEWNAQLLREKWRGRIFPDLHKFTQTPPWDAPRQDISSPAPIRQDTDVHFAVPVQFGNAFTWSAMRLASACENAGMKVSFDVNSIHSSIDRKDRAILKTFMSRAPSRKFQIRWGHFWHPYINRTLTAEINAELMAINYLYPPQPLHNLDFWMRHTVMNGYIKLPMSGYCAETLRNIGVPDRQNLILHHGFSPEVLQATGAGVRFCLSRYYQLTYRYGTDVLISAFAKAFAGRSDVLLVLKD
jgi:Glycosyl transferase family 2